MSLTCSGESVLVGLERMAVICLTSVPASVRAGCGPVLVNAGLVSVGGAPPPGGAGGGTDGGPPRPCPEGAVLRGPRGPTATDTVGGLDLDGPPSPGMMGRITRSMGLRAAWTGLRSLSGSRATRERGKERMAMMPKDVTMNSAMAICLPLFPYCGKRSEPFGGSCQCATTTSPEQTPNLPNKGIGIRRAQP